MMCQSALSARIRSEHKKQSGTEVTPRRLAQLA
jgi:hypothetical protein